MATKAELTTGSASAATEHTEEPQLAERPNNHSAATEHTQNKKKAKSVRTGSQRTVEGTVRSVGARSSDRPTVRPTEKISVRE